MDYQELVEQAAKTSLPENFGKLLRPLLSSDGPLLAALGQIRRRAQEMAWSLQVADLTSEEGRADALKKQGMINGLMQAIDVVLDPVKDLEEGDSGSEKLAA